LSEIGESLESIMQKAQSLTKEVGRNTILFYAFC